MDKVYFLASFDLEDVAVFIDKEELIEFINDYKPDYDNYLVYEGWPIGRVSSEAKITEI